MCGRALYWQLGWLAATTCDDVLLLSLVPAHLCRVYYHPYVERRAAESGIRAEAVSGEATYAPIFAVQSKEQPKQQRCMKLLKESKMANGNGRHWGINPDLNAHACDIKTVRDLA